MNQERERHPAKVIQDEGMCINVQANYRRNTNFLWVYDMHTANLYIDIKCLSIGLALVYRFLQGRNNRRGNTLDARRAQQRAKKIQVKQAEQEWLPVSTGLSWDLVELWSIWDLGD